MLKPIHFTQISYIFKLPQAHYVRNVFSSHFSDLNEFDCWLKQYTRFEMYSNFTNFQMGPDL